MKQSMLLSLLVAVFAIGSSSLGGSLAGNAGASAGVEITAERDETQTIRRILDRQVAAWNEGNLKGFMEDFWQSDELTFSAGGQTTRGWQATLDRYRSRYPDARAMGQLRFGELEIELIGEQKDVALVLGRWYLSSAERAREGNFTLVLVQKDNRWVIIHDHSSVVPDDE